MAFTKLYLSNATALFTPATLRGAWDQTAQQVTRALFPNPVEHSGANAVVTAAETSTSGTFDVLLYRGVSGPLATQTISGTVDVIIGVTETNTSDDFFWHLHIYCTQGDTDTPRGTLLTDYVENTTNEWPASLVGGAETGVGLQSAQTLSSLGITAGDRMVVELGYIARNTSATSKTGRLRYGYTLVGQDLTIGGDAVEVGNGFLVFSNSITEVDSEVRATQFAVEAAVGLTNTELRATQFGVEALMGVSQPLRATQFTVEVLITNLHPPEIELPDHGLGLTWVELTGP